MKWLLWSYNSNNIHRVKDARDGASTGRPEVGSRGTLLPGERHLDGLDVSHRDAFQAVSHEFQTSKKTGLEI